MGTRKLLTPSRSEVYLVSFDPALGAEIKKTRPALIVQNDIGNQRSPLTIIAAITSSRSRRGPVGILINAGEGGLLSDSVVLLNQIRSVDRYRLLKRLGVLHPHTMQQVDRALKISFGLLEV